MVRLSDAGLVAVLHGFCAFAHDGEEEVDADGEVGGPDESGTGALDQVAHMGQLGIPAGSADDHVGAGVDGGFNVGHHRVRGSEVDDGIDTLEALLS